MLKQKSGFGNEKVPKISIEVGCQVRLVGRHIEEQAVFCVSGCPYFPNGIVRHCACNPLSQNTTAHITTVAMDDVICLGHRSHRAFLLLVRTSVDCYWQILINLSFRVELKMSYSKWIYRGKIDHLFRFLRQFLVRKKGNLDVMKLHESCHK